MSSNYPFSSNQSTPFILWCYTGGGHFFEEIFEQIRKVNHESISITFVFSNAGALVANRYGFFWNLIHSDVRKEYLHFIFENSVAKYNIENMLKKADFSYSIISKDPSFSVAVSLANSGTKCIIACPLTANTAAKLALGITDSFISNLVSSGLKSGKRVGILPTDVIPQKIKTKLPVRIIKSVSSNHINVSVCKFNAIKELDNKRIQFHPQFCVGCQECVKKYPDVFSYGDEIEVMIRDIDSRNIQNLSSELTVLQKPREIYPFIKQFFK
ncbi:MAG: flavoprotein [Promethearchaeota archaeon]